MSAFKGAGVTLITEANNHGEDCGPTGLQTALATRVQTGYTILGIGQDSAQSFPRTRSPSTASITATGRHIDSTVWRLATIVDDLPPAALGRRGRRGHRRVEPGPLVYERDSGAGTIVGV